MIPPPDPTRSHQIPPYSTNIMRPEVLKMCLCVLTFKKKCGCAS
jgi:hypothetical protein